MGFYLFIFVYLLFTCLSFGNEKYKEEHLMVMKVRTYNEKDGSYNGQYGIGNNVMAMLGMIVIDGYYDDIGSGNLDDIDFTFTLHPHPCLSFCLLIHTRCSLFMRIFLSFQVRVRWRRG